MTISVTAVSVSAKCPSGTIHVNQNVTLSADIKVTAKNDGTTGGNVKVSMSINDSDGNSNTATQYFTVGAGKTESASFTPYFSASYDSKGTKTSTAKATAEASNSKSDDDNCSFKVT